MDEGEAVDLIETNNIDEYESTDFFYVAIPEEILQEINRIMVCRNVTNVLRGLSGGKT